MFFILEEGGSGAGAHCSHLVILPRLPNPLVIFFPHSCDCTNFLLQECNKQGLLSEASMTLECG